MSAMDPLIVRRSQPRYSLSLIRITVCACAWCRYNSSSRHAVPTGLNLWSNTLKQQASPASHIVARNHPLPVTQLLESLINSAVALASTLFIMIAFSFVPASVVAFIVREREAHHNSKHQQLISGVSCSVVASTSTSTTGGQGASLQDARGIRRVEKIYTVRGGGMLESVF